MFRKGISRFAQLKRLCTTLQNATHFLSDTKRGTRIGLLKCATAVPKFWDPRAVKGGDNYLLRICIDYEIRVMGNDDYLSRLFSGAEIVDQVRIRTGAQPGKPHLHRTEECAFRPQNKVTLYRLLR